jgi:hypothetical protein
MMHGKGKGRVQGRIACCPHALLLGNFPLPPRAPVCYQPTFVLAMVNEAGIFCCICALHSFWCYVLLCHDNASLVTSLVFCVWSRKHLLGSDTEDCTQLKAPVKIARKKYLKPFILFCFGYDTWPLLWPSGQSSCLHNGDVLCFLWGTNWIYICYVEESRPPLWSRGRSFWQHNGDVMCFLWGTNWIYICYVEESRPPLWSGGQSFWLHIQMSGFNSRRHQI